MNGRGLLLGLWLLARFRPEGLALFGTRRQDLLNSLAPLIAFPVVFTLIAAVGGPARAAVSDLLMEVIGLLGPLVFSHALARRWQRETLWLRYAVASNWWQFMLTAVAGAVIIQLPAILVLLLPYAAAQQWFIARRGLDLPAWRAVLFVLLINAATALLLAGPQMLRQAMAGAA